MEWNSWTGSRRLPCRFDNILKQLIIPKQQRAIDIGRLQYLNGTTSGEALARLALSRVSKRDSVSSNKCGSETCCTPRPHSFIRWITSVSYGRHCTGSIGRRWGEAGVVIRKLNGWSGVPKAEARARGEMLNLRRYIASKRDNTGLC